MDNNFPSFKVPQENKTVKLLAIMQLYLYFVVAFTQQPLFCKRPFDNTNPEAKAPILGFRTMIESEKG